MNNKTDKVHKNAVYLIDPDSFMLIGFMTIVFLSLIIISYVSFSYLEGIAFAMNAQEVLDAAYPVFIGLQIIGFFGLTSMYGFIAWLYIGNWRKQNHPKVKSSEVK